MRRAVVVVVGVLAIFHLAGGWYFAEQLRRDALQPDHELPTDDVSILEAGEGMVRLGALPGFDPDLTTSGIIGLDWGTGYGQLGSGFTAADDGSVTRSIQRLSGEAAQPGDTGFLDGNAFPGDPSQAFGLDFTEIDYPTALGPMKAWRILAPGDVWVIHVHGLGASRREALRLIKPLAAAGFPQLVIDYRNDDGAPIDESGFYRFGATEWEDIAAAVDQAASEGATGIVLVGYSTGAAHILSYLQKTPDHPVLALILDSPNVDFEQSVDLAASQRRLPLIPLPLPGTLIWTAKRLATLRFGIDWEATDYLPEAALLSIPMLVIHGTEDETVPFSVSEELASAQPDLARLFIVPGAGHVRGWNVGPQPYERAVTDFLSDVLPT
ncbi:MAG TPA: alpha/beta fold hydrolase [Acidimicrobiia bacterium]|nr:alpha/beta fold hydrolase [Acidimicrobiia bacterium]